MRDSIHTRTDDLVGDDEVILEPDDSQGQHDARCRTQRAVEALKLEKVEIEEHAEEEHRLRFEDVAARLAPEGRDAEILRKGMAFFQEALGFEDAEIGFEVGKLMVAHGRHLIQKSPGPAIRMADVPAERLAKLDDLLNRPGTMIQDANGRWWHRKEGAGA